MVDEVVGEFRELIEDDVVLVGGELGALVVDFLDVAFRAGRADDVGGIRNPLRQPVEALPAHAGGQHGHAAATENARYGNAAAAVVSGRRPDRPLMLRVELAGHQPRHQTGIRGEHLVCADHREAVAEQDDDWRLYAGQGLGQDHMARQRHPIPAGSIVEPVNTPQVLPVRIIRADGVETALDTGRDERRIGQLAPGRQGHAGRAQAFHRRSAAAAVAHFRPDEELMRHVAGAAPGFIAAASGASALAPSGPYRLSTPHQSQMLSAMTLMEVR